MGESSCSSQINKMNFKFLLAVFVVAVALMPTAHSNRGRKTPSRLKERLAAKCRRGTCPKTKTSPGCQAGWSAFNGKCYKYFSEEKTWEDSEDYCKTFDANLASVHWGGENIFVGSLTNK